LNSTSTVFIDKIETSTAANHHDNKQGTDMPRLTALLLSLLLAAIALPVVAGPDEEKLGKSRGYPAGVGASWFFDESVRVGSFTRQGELPGLFQGKANLLAASDAPMILRRAEHEPSIRWEVGRFKHLTVDSYLERQRIMGLMI
jgi:hypothetical protein